MATTAPTTIHDLFSEATGLDATVAADKTTLDSDTALDVAAHSGLVAAVISNGPTFFVQADGTAVILVPQPDGTLLNIVAKDGSQTPIPGPPPAATTAPGG